MNKKTIILIAFIIVFFFTDISYGIKSVKSYTIDSSWVTISLDTANPGNLISDYSGVSAAGKSINNLIGDLIHNGKTKIYIEDGTYQLDGRIYIDVPGVVIVGQSPNNTKLIGNMADIYLIKVEANDFKMANCYIENTIGYAVFHAQNVDDTILENCILTGSGGFPVVAIYGDETSMNSNSKIQGNTIIQKSPSSLGQAIVFRKQNNGDVSNNNVVNGSMDFEICGDLTISYNSVKDSPKGGIRVTLPGNNIKILNNITENTYNSGIAVVAESTDVNRYTGIRVENNSVTKTQYFGIEINNLNGGIISNNEINQIDYDGIYLLRSDNLTVEENKINDCSLGLYNGNSSRWTPTSLNSAMILDASVKNSKIKNNTIYNNNNCPFGIKVRSEGTSDNSHNEIIDNNISGNFGSAISPELGDTISNTNTDFSTNIILVSTEPVENTIELTWNKILDGATYEIERTDQDGTKDTHQVIDDNEYIESGLIMDKEYTYKVRMKYGAWSDPITTIIVKKPNVSASPTENSINVSWDPISGVDEYEIKVDGSILNIGGSNSYLHDNLASNSQHNYKVRVKKKNGLLINGPWATISATTLMSPNSEIPTPSTSPPAVVITPPEDGGNTTSPAVVITPGKGGTGGSKPSRPSKPSSSSSGHSHNDNDNVSIEFSLEDYKTLSYKDDLMKDYEENKLKKMILYAFLQEYHFSLKKYEGDKVTVDYHFSINNILPGNLFTEKEVTNMLKNSKDNMDMVLVKDLADSEDTQKKNNFAQYSQVSKYILSMNDTGMKLKKNNSYVKK